MASTRDAATIAEIYREHVLHGTATFETEPPDVAEILRRMEAVRQLGLPYLVAEHAGDVIGYAYAGQFRPRPAYRFTARRESRGAHDGSFLLTTSAFPVTYD